MDNYDKLNRAITSKLKELEAIDTFIAEKQAERAQKANIVEGMQAALKIMNRTPVKVSLRKGSDTEKVYNVLLAIETPLHVDDLLLKIGKTGGGAKASLVGTLNAYANDGKVFSKPAPNTFGLLEKDYADVS